MNSTLYLLALVVLATGCRSAGHLPVARDFVPLHDAFGDSADLMAVLEAEGLPPWTVLIGGADEIERVLAARAAATPAATLIDLSLVEPMQHDAVAARALEAILELDGALLLDDVGANSRALRGGERAPMLIVLGADRSIVSATPVASDEPGESTGVKQ